MHESNYAVLVGTATMAIVAAILHRTKPNGIYDAKRERFHATHETLLSPFPLILAAGTLAYLIALD